MSIEQADMLHGVSATDAARLTALGSRVHVPTGTQLFELGADAHDVFLIERGRIALTLPMRIGPRQEDALVEERTAGQMVGWSGLIPPHRFTLKASAQIDTDVLVLPRAAVFAFFDANPAIGYVVMQNLASIVGQRLQVFQAMWLREMQRFVESRSS
ncbi:MAG: Crp/Fnr family transcriptional regulator [Rhodospirillaceae bacterium]